MRADKDIVPGGTYRFCEVSAPLQLLIFCFNAHGADFDIGKGRAWIDVDLLECLLGDECAVAASVRIDAAVYALYAREVPWHPQILDGAGSKPCP
jgi:hypothetical protein